MITVKTVRFVKTMSFPGNRAQTVISREKPADARDFAMEFDPRLRLLFVDVAGESYGYPLEQIERMDFDAASMKAFREARPSIDVALDQRRKTLAAVR